MMIDLYATRCPLTRLISLGSRTGVFTASDESFVQKRDTSSWLSEYMERQKDLPCASMALKTAGTSVSFSPRKLVILQSNTFPLFIPYLNPLIATEEKFSSLLIILVRCESIFYGCFLEVFSACSSFVISSFSFTCSCSAPSIGSRA